MKQYSISFSQYGITLDGNTKEELTQAFLSRFGNPQNAFSYIINNLSFDEIIVNDAKIVKEDDTRESVQETPSN